MFYSRLRWKIKDLQDEINKLNCEALCREKDISGYIEKIRCLEDDLFAVKNKNEYLTREMNMMQGRRSDLLELRSQIDALLKENKELTDENKELRKKGDCPCNKRINSKKSKI